MGTLDQNAIALTIVGMAVVTYLPRLLPMLLLTRKGHSSSGLSPWIEAWLRHVPAAVLAAMLLPSLFIADGQVSLRPDNLHLWAAVPTLLIAWKTRSLFGALVAGMAIVALGRLVLG
jgi:branched-subunit amino acid transport protein